MSLSYDKLSSGDILSFKMPEKLFTELEIHSEYKTLAKIWHPDVSTNKDAENVFKHIGILYQEGLDKINNKTWNFDENTFMLKTTSGKTFKIKFQLKREFELGTEYILHESIIYIIKKINKDLFDNAIRNIRKIKYEPEE